MYWIKRCDVFCGYRVELLLGFILNCDVIVECISFNGVVDFNDIIFKVVY